MDDFEVIREIGKGGMGTVFLARQLSTGRRVAVKILPRGISSQGAGRERFQREIKALASVNHPNVVPVYAAGEDGGCLFYAMELIEGETLADYVNRKKLGEKDILSLFLNVLEGVAAMHQAGIIHRDLKPNNILVDAAGVPRIVDLGLALFVDEEGDHPGQISVTTPYLGTPAFMAPEQCGNGGRVDVRTDVYSLGGVLYLLLLGALPYPVPKDPLKAIEIIRTRPPTAPGKLEKNFPVDLATVLLKALAKAPRDRYGTVAEFSADIKNVLYFRPISARPPTKVYVAGKFVRRNWRPLTGVGLWLCLFAAVIIFAFISIDRSRRQAIADRDAAVAARRGEEDARLAQAREAYSNTIAIVRHKIAGGRDGVIRVLSLSELAWARETSVPLLAVSANGTVLAGGETLRAERLLPAESAAVVLRSDSPPVLNAALSDSGAKAVVSSRQSPVVEVYDTATGQGRAFPTPGGLSVMRLFLSRKSAVCLTVDERRHVFALDVDSGEYVMSWGTSSPPYALSDTGDMLVMGESNTTVNVFSSTGERLYRFELSGVRAACFSPDSRLLALARENDVIIKDTHSGADITVLQPLVFAGGDRSLGFSPDSARLAVGELDGASVWNTKSSHKMLENVGPRAPVSRIVFMDDERLLVTGETGETWILDVME
ncbi:MAG: serine/threonine-protein kinase [Lentisphaeria bacterium]|nr:serine/threonine-protein kinase [Lentisphaeria bacterium]